MSTIKVDTIATRTGSGSITASNTIAGTSATLSGTLGVTGATTLSSNVGVNGGTGGQVAVNYSTASTTGLKLNDTNSGNLGGFIDFRSGSGAGTQRATIQNANNAGIHVNVGTGGSLSFGTGYTAANALNDYEEGTWSAELRGASSRASTPVISTTAKYTKIGNTVYVAVYFANVNTSGASGTCQVTGLPFTCINQLFPLNVMTYGFDYDDAVGIMTINMYVENGTTAQLIATKDNAAWQSHGITAGTGKYFAMQGTYITDS